MCLAVSLGALLAFFELGGITNLTDYFRSMHTEQQQGQPEASTPTDGQGGSETTPGEGGTDGTAPSQPATPQKDGDLTLDTEPLPSGKEAPPVTDMGTLTTENTQEVPNPGPDGLVRHSKIAITEKNLEWTHPDKYPHPGDMLSIEVPVNHKYVFQVLAFEKLPDDEGLVVHADLCDVKGQVLMMFYKDHFSLQLTDFENNRAYSIYYNVKDNFYTVDERDMTLIHTTPAPATPADIQQHQ